MRDILTEVIEREARAKSFRQRALILSEAALRIRCARAAARLRDSALAAAIEAERSDECVMSPMLMRSRAERHQPITSKWRSALLRMRRAA